jgi:ribose transport system substrate-binding protein
MSNKHRTRLAIGITVLLGAASVAAVASGARAGTHSTRATYTLAYMDPASSNPFQLAFQCGLVHNASAYGFKIVDIATDGTFSPQKQIPLLQAQAAKKPNVLITDPTNPTAVTQTLKEVIGQGTKVVVYDQPLVDKSVASASITQDNYAGGVALAKYVVKKTGGVGSALLIDYQPASGASSDRIDGFKSVMKNYPKFKMYGPFYDDFVPTKDASIVDSAIAAHPDLTMIIPSYNNAAENTVQALQAAGKLKKIKVFTFDGDPQLLRAVRDGNVSVLVSQQPELEAKTTLKLAQMVAQGKKVPYQTNIPLVMITRQNIDTPSAKAGYYGSKPCS